MLGKIQEKTWLQALIIAAAVVIAGVLLGWYNNKVIPLSTAPLSHYTQETGNPLNFLGEWDSIHFTDIAQNGYQHPWQPAFFPLYPILIRALTIIVGSPLMAALIISWLSLFGAVYFYIKIVAKLWRVNFEEKLHAVLYFALFPTAVFFLAAYSEALYAFLALAALYYCLDKKYLMSGLFLIGVTDSRVTGIFVVALVALFMLKMRQKLTKTIAIAALGCTGIATYAVFLQFKFGNFLQFLTAESYWGRFSGNYFDSLTHYGLSVLSIGAFGLTIIAAIYWFRKKSWPLGIYSGLFALLPIVSGQFVSFTRFVVTDFPIMLMLYSITRRRPTLRVALLLVSAIGWAYFMMQFAGGYTGG